MISGPWPGCGRSGCPGPDSTPGAETVPRVERSERRVASGIADQPEERQLIEGRRGRMPDEVGEAIERLEAVLALGLQLDDGPLVQFVGQVEHCDDALGVDAAAAVVDVQLTRKGPRDRLRLTASRSERPCSMETRTRRAIG